MDAAVQENALSSEGCVASLMDMPMPSTNRGVPSPLPAKSRMAEVMTMGKLGKGAIEAPISNVG